MGSECARVARGPARHNDAMSDPRSKAVPSSWAGPLALWSNRLAAAGRSAQTIGLRRAHIAQLSRGVEAGPHDLTVDELLAWLADRDWSRETRRAWRATLRAFFAEIGRLDLEAVPAARAAEPRPRPIAEDDLQLTLRLVAGGRVWLILRLAAQAGLRRGEIAQIHAHDLSRDLLGWSLLVHGKGDKPREVPLTDDLASAVRLACGDSWMLPGQINGHLSARRVGELAAEALPAPWTLHTLRHRFATRAYEATGDLVTVSRLLGHASVATTQRYVATGRARLREVADAAA